MSLKCNTTDVTCGAGNASPSGVLEGKPGS